VRRRRDDINQVRSIAVAGYRSAAIRSRTLMYEGCRRRPDAVEKSLVRGRGRSMSVRWRFARRCSAPSIPIRLAVVLRASGTPCGAIFASVYKCVNYLLRIAAASESAAISLDDGLVRPLAGRERHPERIGQIGGPEPALFHLRFGLRNDAAGAVERICHGAKFAGQILGVILRRQMTNDGSASRIHRAISIQR
jgi:hypothetical protein